MSDLFFFMFSTDENSSLILNLRNNCKTQTNRSKSLGFTNKIITTFYQSHPYHLSIVCLSSLSTVIYIGTYFNSPASQAVPENDSTCLVTLGSHIYCILSGKNYCSLFEEIMPTRITRPKI